jgi:hypothetical protein
LTKARPDVADGGLTARDSLIGDFANLSKPPALSTG